MPMMETDEQLSARTGGKDNGKRNVVKKRKGGTAHKQKATKTPEKMEKGRCQWCVPVHAQIFPVALLISEPFPLITVGRRIAWDTCSTPTLALRDWTSAVSPVPCKASIQYYRVILQRTSVASFRKVLSLGVA